MPLLDPGASAPDFTLPDQNAQTHTLSAYRGSPVVLFFYPKDSTSGCTQEACDFRDASAEFAAVGVRVLGISILNVRSKKKFATAESLDYPLLADDRTNDAGKPDPLVAQLYGVWAEKSMYGRKYMGIERTTYLIDAKGKVAQRWDKVKVPGHVDEVLEAARALSAGRR